MDKNDIDTSELEREFELEMDEGQELAEDSEQGDDSELEEEFSSEDSEFDSTSEFEELDEEHGQSVKTSYAERFFEISQKEFESEFESEVEIRRVLDDMEKEYFWRPLKNLGRKALKGLIKKGMSYAKGLPAFKALKGITQLARGDLKGMLSSLAKAGLPMALSAIPGGAAALPAMKALGFETAQDADANREAWEGFVELSRESFEYLANNIDSRAVDPLVAGKLASDALQAGLNSIQSGRSRGRMTKRRTFRIGIRKGEHLRIIIEGV